MSPTKLLLSEHVMGWRGPVNKRIVSSIAQHGYTHHVTAQLTKSQNTFWCIPTWTMELRRLGEYRPSQWYNEM